MTRSAAAALLLSLSIAAPASAAPQNRIVNGAPASQSYPHQAFVEVFLPARNQTQTCGGSLIAARWVLTAAHCVTDETSPGIGTQAQPQDVLVYLGSTDRDAGTEYPVTLVARHPDWDNRNPPRGDIAVLRLATIPPVAPVPWLRPADAGVLTPGRYARVIGWGQTETGSPSQHLREADVPLLSDPACGDAFGAIDLGQIICAGGEGRDTCSGDSGGPLLLDVGGFQLAGVTSFGSVQCATPGVPAGYARTTGPPLADWIRSGVPTADFEVPGNAEPARALTFANSSTNPTGPYTSLRWDLDGDGQFNDAGGPTASRVYPAGVHVVALEASNEAGDREVRRRAIDVQPRTPVSWTATGVRVVEGARLTVKLVKAGAGTGSISVVRTGGTAGAGDIALWPFAAPIGWGPADTERTFTLTVPDDRIAEPDETAVLGLTAPTDALLVGTPAAVTVTIDDSKDRLPTLRGKRRTFRPDRRTGSKIVVPLRLPVRGRYDIALIRGGLETGRLYATRRFSPRRTGATRLTLKLTRRARLDLRRSRSGKLRVRLLLERLIPNSIESDVKVYRITVKRR